MSVAAGAAVRFSVNGRPVEADGPGSRRLLDVLREDLGLTGTKEGCGEGECGACSVLVDGRVVDSCLVPLCQVDGCDVRTIEGLADDARLSSLRDAFLAEGSVQCGFCTPGMIASAAAFLESGAEPTDAAVREAIAGNLCRCTGYTKIVEAIRLAVRDEAGRAPDDGGGTAAIPVGERPMATHVACPDGRDGEYRVTVVGSSRAGGTDDSGEGVPAAHAAAGHAAAGHAAAGHAAAAVVAGTAAASRRPVVSEPTTLAEAIRILAASPHRPMAGGTDVMVALATGAWDDAVPLLDLWGLDELRGIRIEDGSLMLGALSTYAELRGSALVQEHVPALAEMAATVGAAQIQNRGTLGGNVVNASPAGDALPLLLATDAEIVAGGIRGERTIPSAVFWTGYRRTALQPDELVLRVRVPLAQGRRTAFRKIGTRRAQAIAKASIAVSWRPGPDGSWHDVRVALGAVAERAIRAPRTEAWLEGRRPSVEAADEAGQVVAGEIAPIDDVRSTAEYRRAVVARVLRRIVLEAARRQ
jgi:xanthine dehydrogenase small subunit